MTKILLVEGDSMTRAIAQRLIQQLGDMEVTVLDAPPDPQVYRLHSFGHFEQLPVLDAACLKRTQPQSDFLARKGRHYGAGRKR
jgi:hypothetical protein